MALETGTYISDLVVTNPTAADAKSQGDDHLRLIKSALKNTFTAITGAITVTQIEINKLSGLLSTTAELNILHGVTKTTAELNDAATKTYVDSVAMSTALPGQAGNAGKVITTNGSLASWQDLTPQLHAVALYF